MKRWLYFPGSNPNKAGMYLPTSFGGIRLAASFFPTTLGRTSGSGLYLPMTLGRLIKTTASINAPNTAEFTYQSDGDDKGLFYAMGSNFGLAAWANPHSLGTITVSSSSVAGGTVDQIVDRSISQFVTIDAVNSSVEIFIGQEYLFQPKQYLIRSGDSNAYQPRNWNLEGSLNGFTWEVIDDQVNNTSITSANQWLLLSVPKRKVEAYSYFRLKSTGLNSNGTHHLSIGELELYGTFSKVGSYIPAPVPPINMLFTYQSDGDLNGVLFAIGSDFGDSAWKNPSLTKVAVSASSVLSGTLNDLTDRQVNDFYTDNTPSSYIQIDLKDYALSCDKYSIRNRNSTTHVLRNWKLEGSNNKISWVLLDSQSNNSSINTANEWLSLTPNASVTTAFRIFRLTQTGGNNFGANYLCLSEIEFYGQLSALPPGSSLTVVNQTYTYSSNGDDQGLFYALGTGFGNSPWINPVSQGLVLLSASTALASSYDPSYAVNRGASSNPFHSQNNPNEYLQWDLLSGNSFVCKHYTIMSRQDANSYISKTWNIEGSNDGTNWTIIDSVADAGFTGGGQWFSKSTSGNTTAFRYHRLRQTGPNDMGSNHLTLGEIEFYGIINYTY